MSARVQIPAYTDRWMMGDRFGTVIKTNAKSGVATVLMEKSGKTIKVILDDCQDA